MPSSCFVSVVFVFFFCFCVASISFLLLLLLLKAKRRLLFSIIFRFPLPSQAIVQFISGHSRVLSCSCLRQICSVPMNAFRSLGNVFCVTDRLAKYVFFFIFQPGLRCANQRCTDLIITTAKQKKVSI